ncbi:CPCC family cysteine-rich protein [Nonomuraea sp. NPDC049695]|uniref:CPCC family cysteine-rich protein n=1 Tax=Nonomuraea sp. NPDC049695 TaxID=3154734 RepID=UPI003419AD1D
MDTETTVHFTRDARTQQRYLQTAGPSRERADDLMRDIAAWSAVRLLSQAGGGVSAARKAVAVLRQSGPTMGEHPSAGQIRERKRWIMSEVAKRNGAWLPLPRRDRPYTCPCCFHPTLEQRGCYEICEECWWEDDGQDDDDADLVKGGPNGPESLTAARRRYRESQGLPPLEL